MRIFAIADLHLAGGSGKTMDMFGEGWRDHDLKIFSAWEQTASEDDILIIAGDVSWAMRLEDAQEDLDRIGRLRGRKILLRGNHDYWWPTRAKLLKVLDPSIEPVQASFTIINRVAIAGTRGWLCPNDICFEAEDARIYEREVGRLALALNSLEKRRDDFDRLIVALHYPPVNDRHEPSGFSRLIDEHGADVCIYGHLHGDAIGTGITGIHNRTGYYLVSADSTGFSPVEIDLKL